jgi:lipopolysaccharide transport system ATP-binding protein
MSADDAVVVVENISKCYYIYDRPSDRLKQFVLGGSNKLLGRPAPRYHREFWALKDVTFKVRKGETLGILGRNGSGKSTLLQIICGTLEPTLGSIKTTGRLAALLELGSGFNPEFTGRENVYLNASLLGLTASEIDSHFDSILSFADIGTFIDQPVKTYSSGMFVRLAFAVIANVKADILVIDEALAVGDIFFQQKCMRFLRSFQESGGTILFVSHDTSAVVRMCQSAVLLSGGSTPPILGETEGICKLYLMGLYDEPTRRAIIERGRVEATAPAGLESSRAARLQGVVQQENLYTVSAFRPDAESFGQGGATIVDVAFLDLDGRPITTLQGGEITRFLVQVRANRRIPWPAIGFMLKDRLGQYVFTEGTDAAFRQQQVVFEPGDVVAVTFTFQMPILMRGKYTFNVAVAEGIGHDHIQHHWLYDAVELESVTSRVVHGICGLTNLEITMEWCNKTREAEFWAR